MSYKITKTNTLLRGSERFVLRGVFTLFAAGCVLFALLPMSAFAQKTLFTGSAGTRATKAFYILNASGDTLFFSTGDSTRIKKDLYILAANGDTTAKFTNTGIEIFESLNINSQGEFTNLELNLGVLGTVASGQLKVSNLQGLAFGFNSEWVLLTEHAFGYDPAAGFSPADSGATDTTLANRESVKAFSGATNEYAYYSVFPPYGYEAEFDSLAMLVSTNSSAGDSVGWGFDQLGIAADSLLSNAYATEVTKQFDLGTTANKIVLLLWRFGQDPEDRWRQTERFMKYLFRLRRDTGISNNESADVLLHGIWLHMKPKT